MMRRLTLWTAAVVFALVAQATAGQKSSADATGAWTVTITLSSGEAVTGLAIDSMSEQCMESSVLSLDLRRSQSGAFATSRTCKDAASPSSS